LAHDAIELIPPHAAALTTPIEPFEQKPAAGIQIPLQTSDVATDSKILEVATEMLLHILHHGSTTVRPQNIQTHAEFLQRLPHAQLVRLVADLDPGVACVACRCATQVVACWGHETIGTHLRGYFRTQSFKDSLTCYPLRLASFRTYASSIASP
jgi:hypothetical protein